MIDKNIQRLLNLFKIITKKQTNVPLGRWNINQSKNNIKIDYSNEDHCGTCSEYILQKKIIKK